MYNVEYRIGKDCDGKKMCLERAKRAGGRCKSAAGGICIAHSGVGSLICRGARMAALKAGALSEVLEGHECV